MITKRKQRASIKPEGERTVEPCSRCDTPMVEKTYRVTAIGKTRRVPVVSCPTCPVTCDGWREVATHGAEGIFYGHPLEYDGTGGALTTGTTLRLCPDCNDKRNAELGLD